MKFKVGEDSQHVYVQPIIVAKLQYTDVYRGVENRVLEYSRRTARATITCAKGG